MEVKEREAVRERGSAKAIAELIRMRGKISHAEMADIAKAAKAAGGALVSVTGFEGDDDWCGTGRIILKWPPRQDEFYKLLDHFVVSRLNWEVLINGIPVPEELMIDVSRRW